MVVIRKVSIVLILLSIISISNASTKSNIKLQKKIINIKNKILHFKKEIDNLESTLENKNKAYLVNENNRQEIEKKLSELRNENMQINNKVEKYKQETIEHLKHLAANSIGSENTIDNLLLQRILTKRLHRKLLDLEVNKVQLSETFKSIDKMDDNLNINHQTKMRIVDELSSLERNKKKAISNYQSNKKKRKQLEKKISYVKKLKKKRLRKSSGISLGSPLKHYTTVKKEKKGLAFSYEGIKKIYSTGSGKVVYKGPLASYGDVIMIDHGKETWTVLLGEFNSTIKKGALLKKGDILGSTKTGSNKLYFEIRQKNKKQKITKFIDKNISRLL
ncbi:MAG: M23 family metallopeptidase [Bdellovibrionales bacterium]|nr:M23 family metallopeptidase [Bdellovibrionales bacterium]